MANILPFQDSCCTPCDEITVVNVPGVTGPSGADGTDGVDGVNAYTYTTAIFIVPAMGATVTADVADSSWMTDGQMLYVEGAGYMLVVSSPTDTTVVLRNVENVGGDYASNSAPGTSIAAGSTISPAGIQGPAGTGAGAGGTPTLTFRTVAIAADNVLAGDDMILVEAAMGVTLAMITAVGRTGEYFIIKRSTNMAFGVTIDAQPGELIDGQASVTMMFPGESLTLISNGANWFII